MIVIVSGSRSINSKEIVNTACDTLCVNLRERFHASFDLLKHGAAIGVDLLAANWAEQHNIAVLPFPAQWKLIKGLPKEKVFIKYDRFNRPYNALAGFLRNEEMLNSGFDFFFAIRCLGISKGTDDAIRRAREFKKPCFIYREDGAIDWINI